MRGHGLHHAPDAGDETHGVVDALRIVDVGDAFSGAEPRPFAKLQRDLQARPQGGALVVRVDVGHRLRAVHAHTQTVHDQPPLVEEIVEDPVHDGHRLVQPTGARHHDRRRAVGRDVVEGLPCPPRQHARERVDAGEHIEFQVGELLRDGDVLEFPGARQRQRHPGLVVVVFVAGQFAALPQADAADGVADDGVARLGAAAHGRVDQAIQVMGLPPVVPVGEHLLLRHGRPADHGEVGSGQSPDTGGMPVVDGAFSEVSAVGPCFVHVVVVAPGSWFVTPS